MASAFAAIAMPSYDRRFTADWAQDNERRAAGQQAEQQRMADHLARLTQEQEERENAEARERFAESQRNRHGGNNKE
jgi:Lon protease-like protein